VNAIEQEGGEDGGGAIIVVHKEGVNALTLEFNNGNEGLPAINWTGARAPEPSEPTRLC